MKMDSWIKKIKWEYNNVLRDIVTDIYGREIKDFFFIEIGACDGIRDDFARTRILKYKWQGILIEPVKCLFERLVDNYKGQENLIFENVAISDKEEIRKFYRIKKHDGHIPSACEGVGSFYSDLVVEHRSEVPDIENYLLVETVKCITFESLLQKNDVKKVDLLQIDAEGHDYAILKNVDFNVIKPKMIQFEHRHLNNDDKKECIAMLKDSGYIICDVGHDTFAFLTTPRMCVEIYVGMSVHLFKRVLRKLTKRKSETNRFRL